MIYNHKKAFTLVELIVAITILAILWIIAFMAFQGYSKNSRDSVRISDISKIITSLEIFAIEAWKYPIPTNWTNITFSGWIIWDQGTFWESVFKNLEKLNKVPTDPLVNKEYTYSTTINRRQFQIGGISEWDAFTRLNLINNSFAWEKTTNALVVWNYNWLVTTTLSWTLCHILTVPTIIANNIEESTDYEKIVNNKRLVFNWFKNIPSSFRKSKFKLDWGFDFTPNNLIVYSDNDSCNILATDEVLRINLLKNIQQTYSWTILKNKSRYSTLLSLDINTWAVDRNNSNITSLAWNIWRIVLGKKVKVTYSIENLMWICKVNWKEIDNWKTITMYSESYIDKWEAYDCQSISQSRTCTESVIDWEETFSHTSCVKWEIENCPINSNYSHSWHIYSIDSILHWGSLNNITSNNIYENNWVFTYNLNAISCNDWNYININEALNWIIISCNYWYTISWNTCVINWNIDINSPDTLSCPFCSP